MSINTASGTAVNGTLTAVPLQLLTGDGEARVILTGTFTGLQGKIQGSMDGTAYVNLAAKEEDIGAPSSGTLLSPGSTQLSYLVKCRGWNYVQFLPTQVSTGTVNIRIDSANSFGGGVDSVPNAAGSAAVSGRLQAQLLAIGPVAADTYAATMTIDVTKSLHVIAAANGTSATCTMTPSGAGNAGDIVTIVTEADASGTVTTTYASTFHPSGTQATTASHFSSVTFMSDGARWVELCRTTALA